MFSPFVIVLAVFLLVVITVGGIAYTLFYEQLTEDRSKKRLDAIAEGSRSQTEKRAAADLNIRRKDVQEVMKELEANQKNKTNQLSTLIAQAGLKWNWNKFVLFSLASGLAFLIICLVLSKSLYVAMGGAVIGVLGFPRWFLSFRRKRRIKQFTNELPNAVDIIVRGIKSGLPLGDCLRIIANEVREPVRGEFRQIIESQQLGMTIADACQKLYERMPVQEANFFGIVVQIQQKAGGNLSEALGNLSKVLRERKKMRAKITAVSQEAKASAAVIGSLPIIVTLLVYLSTPSYIMLLFNTTTGNIIIICGLVYMMIGVLIMRKMINFDF